MDRFSIAEAIIDLIPADENQPRVVYRRSGSDYLLIEYGDEVLDLELRVRIYLLQSALRSLNIAAIQDLVPGVRSLLVHYDGLRLAEASLLAILRKLEVELPPTATAHIPSRLVTLPIACHDRWTREAIERYMNSVRKQAPYLPDNMEFIARANGLTSVDEVIRYILSTEYLVIGLGDVYLGAPCAVPLDPRYRMVVPKYNPARTWTPEGAVGIGGAFMCIYPMESPGGYQLVGRTVQIWNTWQTNAAFAEAPWLLRFFDRVKFELVSEDELEEIRQEAVTDRYTFKIENGMFNLQRYKEFLAEVKDEADAFKQQQQAAIAAATIGY